MVQPRDYYAHRQRGEPLAQNLHGLKRILIAEFSRLEAEKGLFQWHLGKECVDAGRISGQSAGSDPGAYVHFLLDRDIWPFDESLPLMDEDGVFTVIEFLHDHAAMPRESWHHDYAGCGLHVKSADNVSGRAEFRNVVNRYLGRYMSGYELQPNGEIWDLTPPGLEDLLPEATGDSSIDDKVHHAMSMFRRHGATGEQKRDAIRNLADILEHLRDSVGTGLPSKDEADLFKIANNFGIRHHNTRQRTEYDSGVWLDWIFYACLNAVALANAIRNRQTGRYLEPVDDLPF